MRKDATRPFSEHTEGRALTLAASGRRGLASRPAPSPSVPVHLPPSGPPHPFGSVPVRRRPFPSIRPRPSVAVRARPGKARQAGLRRWSRAEEGSRRRRRTAGRSPGRRGWGTVQGRNRGGRAGLSRSLAGVPLSRGDRAGTWGLPVASRWRHRPGRTPTLTGGAGPLRRLRPGAVARGAHK